VLTDLWWYAQSFELPEISTSPPRVNGRSGAMINLAADNMEYGEISVTAILDKEFRVYTELYEFFIKRLNVNSGNFIKYGQFDLWVEVLGGEGTVIKRFDFYKCRLTNFGGVEYDSTTPEDDHQYISLGFVYDYFDYDRTFKDINDTDKNLEPFTIHTRLEV
jgi:hypothetical protein